MMLKSSKAVFPGSFDPCTLGHVDLVQRGCRLFDEVVVLVAQNHQKKNRFSGEQRLAMCQKVFADCPQVRVESWSGLVADYMKQQAIRVLLRGVRQAMDLEWEKTVAATNQHLWNEVETVLLISDPRWSTLSSSVVRDLLNHHASVDGLVPEAELGMIQTFLQEEC